MEQLDFIDLSAARQILQVSACNDGARRGVRLASFVSVSF
jgi:hypothetical protein